MQYASAPLSCCVRPLFSSRHIARCSLRMRDASRSKTGDALMRRLSEGEVKGSERLFALSAPRRAAQNERACREEGHDAGFRHGDNLAANLAAGEGRRMQVKVGIARK